MSTPVGVLSYDITVDTGNQIRAERVANASMARLGDAAGNLQAKFNVITRAVQVYAAALALLKMAEVADDMRLLQARVNVATASIEAGAAAMDKLREISGRTRSALADNVQMFTRLNPSLQQMGGNAGDTLRIVELLGKAITVSGATAAEKSSAMLQFAQAMGSDKLAGDEFRAMMESAPYLMKQLADSLGVPIGQLKTLSSQGKLTSDVIVNALGKAADQINRDFAQMPETLASAMTVAEDQFKRLSKAADDLSGKNSVLTGITKGAGDVMKALAEQLERADGSADKLGKNTGVEDWAKRTRTALSYVVDAGDWLNEKLGKMVSDYGRALEPMVSRVASASKRIVLAYRDALGFAPEPDAPKRSGERMRDQWEDDEWSAGSGPARGKSGFKGKAAAPDPEEARKLAARRAATRAYYEGLLADTQTGLAKIAAEQKKAEAENDRRMAEAKGDKPTTDTLLAARKLIVEKFERERAALEETYAKDRAATAIAITTDEETRIEMIRAEAIRAANAEKDLGVKTAEQAANAKVVAEFEAGQRLIDLAQRNAAAKFEVEVSRTRDTETLIRLERDETIRRAKVAADLGKITADELAAAEVQAERRAQDQIRALRDSRSDTQLDTLQRRANTGGVGDVGAQEALIRAQAARDQVANLEKQAQDQGLASEQLYADQREAIQQEMYRRLAVMRIEALNAESAAYGTMAGSLSTLTDALRSETGKQDAVYKAAFIAQKAFALASAIVSIQAGIAQASNAAFPMNLVGMAQVVAATASIISTIRGTSYGGGRQYGGPVAAGSMYRVNETGRPEMYTAANGAQYMLPTADGKVTNADRLGGQGRQVVNNYHQPITINVPESMSRQTATQLAAEFARRLQVAAARNN